MEKTLEQTPENCLKIVLFGPESTGKTSLAKQLADYYKTNWVPEFARDYLQKKYDDSGIICEPQDLVPIAKGQIATENKLAKTANKVLFCDTNVLQTYAYGQVYYLNFENKILKKAIERHHYDLYLLTNIDIPWQEDDLRDKPDEREEMYAHFKNVLQKRQLPFISVKGNKKERLQQAVIAINNLMPKQ